MYHTSTGDTEVPKQLAITYGYSLFRIDLTEELPRGGDNFQSLDDALDDPRFADWTWVFFDATASDKLSEFVHHADKVVYVFGHDIDGYGRPLNQLPGALVSINTGLPEGVEHTAAICAEAAIVHRFYQVDA